VFGVVVVGLATGRELYSVIETAIALVVATVPEGLPIVATLALARGMWRMAKRDALVDQLSAVETLGATGVILTDKTGTLTENQMTLSTLRLPEGEVIVEGVGLETEGRFLRAGSDAVDGSLLRLLRTAALCTDADLEGVADGSVRGFVGDPTEAALLLAAGKAGLTRRELSTHWPEVRSEAFDPDLKMMATYHRNPAGGPSTLVAVKGAPESVLACCVRVIGRGQDREMDSVLRTRWRHLGDGYAAKGYRVLAVAAKEADSPEAEPYEGLSLLGLVCLVDPPRTDVRSAIESCRQAGIRLVMVTGDHLATAMNVGRAIGLVGRKDTAPALTGEGLVAPPSLTTPARERFLDASVVARTSPEQKLHLIALHQASGAVVAMLGDGVNDAPALKKANIGVAMGRRGTEVAKEAADIVLQNDQLGTVVEAIQQGRIIFNNIRKFVLYLISCNLSEILVVGIAALAGTILPILPLQILFLNLVTDVFPALALAASEGEDEIMRKPPRSPQEPLMTHRGWAAVVCYALLIAAAVLGSLLLALRALEYTPSAAITVSFMTLAWAQMLHVFNMAEPESRLFRNEVSKNPWVWGSMLICAALLLLALYVQPLAQVLGLRPPGAEGWFAILGFGVLPLIGGMSYRVIMHRQPDPDLTPRPTRPQQTRQGYDPRFESGSV
jgi:Ca2+-transporting ATPase